MHRQEEQQHLEVIKDVIDLPRKEAAARDRRGFVRQQARRELEARVRQRVIALALCLKAEGYSHARSARRLGMGRTLLAEWRARAQLNKLGPRPRGRKVQRLSTNQLRDLNDALEVHGPGVSVATLQQIFPKIPRRELRFQLRQYRKRWRKKNRQTVKSLRWTEPGAIWAIDFTKPDQPIDGPFTRILVVRDLASSYTLLWLPLKRATGRSVFMALRALFARHDKPLVIKIDNDKAFEVPDLQRLIEREGILYLKSPPYAPWYNGSVEAGIGVAKVYIHHEAARHDHPEYWTCDDIWAAQRRANYYAHPHGLNGPNANELWDTRTRIRYNDRVAFQQEVLERWASIVTAEQKEQGGELDKAALAQAVRDAIQWVLMARGLLKVGRRRISPAIKWLKASNIL